MKQKTLKEKIQIFETILEHTHIMAVLLDADFNFIWVNRAYADTCGKDTSFFQGKNHFDLYPHEENRAIFKRVVDTGEPFFITAKPFEFPDQPWRGVTYWDWSLMPVKDAAGKVFNLVFTLSEVTDRVLAGKALEESERKYRELVQNASSAIIRWGVDGRITYFNEYAQKFFGYKDEEVLGKEVSILLPVKDSSGTNLTGLVREITAHPEEYQKNINENLLKDGTRAWMAWTNTPVFDENGDTTEILAVGTDITALKNAEVALAKSESEKSLILDNADEIIAYHDVDHNLIWANRAYLDATGLPLSELQGRKCFTCWGLKSLCNNCPVTEAIRTGKPQFAELTPENQEHWPPEQGSWHVRSAPVRDTDGNIIGAIEIANDVTEQKKAESDLQMNEKFYRTVGESIPYGIWQADAAGSCTYVSDSFLEMTGMTMEEIRKFGWLHLLPEEDRKPTVEHWMHCVRTGEPFEHEHRFRSKDGTIKYVLAVGRPVKGSEGEFTGWAGVNLDISERKRTEGTLLNIQHEKEFLAELVNRSSQPFAVGYPDGRLGLHNAAFEILTGYSGEELNKINWTELLTPPEWIETEKEKLEELNRTGIPVRYEKEYIRRDGSRVPIELLVHLVRDDRGEPLHYYSFLTDISERKAAEYAIESSLREKEVLLREIHHRVKNNMQIISSLVSLHAGQLQESSGREVLKDISNRVRSMAMVHEKLYQSTDFASIDFAGYAGNLLNYLLSSYENNFTKVAVKKNFMPVHLSVDRAIPLGLILNELISNVLKHAFEGRKQGEVTITLGKDENGKTILAVRDNGKGLPDNFKLKKSETLGLRLVQMLAEQLHADVKVTRDRGTEFKMILERTDK